MADVPIAVVILAAGQGSRMQSDLPKVLHRLGGVPLIGHALAGARSLDPEQVIVVAGHGADLVQGAVARLDPEARIVLQREQLGTGHAVRQSLPELEGFEGKVVVLYGDTPFIGADTLAALASHPADLVVLGFEAEDPGRYGRLVVGARGLERIVEYKDADAATRQIALCNSGVMALDAARLRQLIGRLGNDNAAGEYYLTDLVALARAEGLRADVVTCDEEETLGINTRAELAAAEAAFQARARAEALENGVTLSDPGTVWFALDTCIGRDAIIGQNVVFGPGVTIESGAEILPFCHLEGCHVSAGATVGPFARLRPGAELGGDAHVGNFVEIKNAVLEEGVKVGHLTYLGDAHVGEHSNIGAGTITCNYDGVGKHRTEIGPRAFIGSDTMLVAPVRVGAEALTGSGSVITQDVPDGALAVARARQANKPGLAVRLMASLRAAKEKR
ncbi:bifunctional UDP-N-acetylglucosamine diphosphorylase/glucosamine-1-phosphate N-acetyltransferase GlmU [Paracoccus sp. R12_1]|jgi:bifunctional UDP-N-acetylglucosamine pyrophosphorylase / glucosamine-1-phosphate N-acetyltransferase|uniref:bifunctional UDP-N-acetylglucosamine diphosphorylase/glucosamine-1-phosphate N-acetyltransferase GlmU n=1 Tax=unclassified Paracoccus (in: a-proteobacteria) TaxID=2688777 RepID=UPI001ADA07CC|nr:MULTISPECIES: bifunctional UDP-N-acetylglucosamine diphosphorylase/glucosamine-1-phosphate N-acetyltransferase GlmU [unclassified Paracoccus (in: a-proteobacteria)]MBO9454589.1 bifunctional UDP-N-acetylglucosamine diphosphorylase/glucosamine-1-phosphate N-acetyltransferase GlmU [Paracoccus sp. R12_2]MBO9486143.1 bifunctional UDP-N-acetylglucosamine diphosphorylase/glucosamine-1-phosphate N-acetyltransferase GlmU [Paracoccus sp. R12_1]